MLRRIERMVKTDGNSDTIDKERPEDKITAIARLEVEKEELKKEI